MQTSEVCHSWAPHAFPLDMAISKTFRCHSWIVLMFLMAFVLAAAQFTSTYTSTISFNLRVSVRVTSDVLLEELCIFQLLDSTNDRRYNTQHSRPWHDIYNAVDTEDIVNIYTHMFTHQSNLNNTYINTNTYVHNIYKMNLAEHASSIDNQTYKDFIFKYK